MHPYATNSKERVNIVLLLAAMSAAITYAFHFLLSRVGYQWPWWLESPSVLASFGVLYLWFDKVLWRFRLLHILGVVSVPDLNAVWHVEGFSATHRRKFTGEIRIRQTWTQISITMEAEYSKSHSITASLLLNQPEGTTLSYEYRNEPKPEAPSQMHTHRGTALLYYMEEEFLQGEYYSGRDRQNYGSLRLTKKDVRPKKA